MTQVNAVICYIRENMCKGNRGRLIRYGVARLFTFKIDT